MDGAVVRAYLAPTRVQDAVLHGILGGWIEVQVGSYCGRSFGRRDAAAADSLVALGWLAAPEASELIQGRGRRHWYTAYTYRVLP